MYGRIHHAWSRETEVSPWTPRSEDEGADPADPGVQPRPTVGIQYVAIPEFQDLGTKVTQEISAAIAGKTSVDKALDDGQKLAEDVAENYRK
ncbi:hypothetical protein QFZ43_008288 [Streptomyces afghaniensis]|nr:hypothetical protein [Streptomyces afghaniensis]